MTLVQAPELLLAGSSTGRGALYKVDPFAVEGEKLQLAYEFGVLNDELTSLHCNATDQYMVASACCIGRLRTVLTCTFLDRRVHA